MSGDKKPKLDEDLIERIAQRLFDTYAKDWSGEHDTRLWAAIDEEEAREWREEARELLTPAYEQGKLDFRNEFLDMVERYCMDGDDMLEWVKCGGLRKSIYEQEKERLKSQLSKDGAKK